MQEVKGGLIEYENKTNLPVISLRLSPSHLNLQLLLSLLRPFELSFKFLLKLLTGKVEVVEFGASFCQHIGHLQVLSLPVRARRGETTGRGD